MKRYLIGILATCFPRLFGIGSGFGELASQRQWIIKQAFIFTNNEEVSGDYVEFGVARGQTLVFAHKAINKYSSKVKPGNLFGFDSFQGFPKPYGKDVDSNRFKQGEEYHGGKKITEKILNRFGVNNVKLIEGWFKDTLENQNQGIYKINKARVVNVDCDLYESTILALNFISSSLQNGTVILFDDWYCNKANPQQGEQQAVHEWLSDNPEIRLIEYNNYANVGKSFIVSLKTPLAKRAIV